MVHIVHKHAHTLFYYSLHSTQIALRKKDVPELEYILKLQTKTLAPIAMAMAMAIITQTTVATNMENSVIEDSMRGRHRENERAQQTGDWI